MNKEAAIIKLQQELDKGGGGMNWKDEGLDEALKLGIEALKDLVALKRILTVFSD